MEVASSWGRGKEELLPHGYGALVLQDEKVLEVSCTTTHTHKSVLNCTLKNCFEIVTSCYMDFSTIFKKIESKTF